MQAPESFRNCHYPSGMSTLSNQFTHIYHNQDGDDDCNCPHPCCSKNLATVWETEREACTGSTYGCLNGDIVRAPVNGLALRCLHVVACTLNVTTALVATPFCCIKGASVAAIASRRPTTATETTSVALQSLKDCSRWSLALFGTALVETVSLPFNVVSPEICNLFCFQQERHLWINQQLKGHQCCPNNNGEEEEQLNDSQKSHSI